MIKLYISVASCRDWKPQFAMSFASLLHNFQSKKLGGKLSAVDMRGCASASLLSCSREAALKVAVNGGFTHWLSLDDDMSFPPDVVDRMVEHDKDVITVNYCRKIPGEVKGVCLALDGSLVDSTHKTGLERVLSMGMGLSLIRVEAIRPIPAPHFEVRWCERLQDYYGEDYVFSQLLGKAGVDIYCDHSVSQDVRHIGDFPYAFPAGG